MTDFNWRPFVRSALRYGWPSSYGNLSSTDDMEFYRADGKIVFRDNNGQLTRIEDVSDVPVHTFHFKGHNARFTSMITKDRLVVKAFTKAIATGVFRLVGSYTCANVLYSGGGTPSYKVRTSRPVPIMLEEDRIMRGEINDHLVSKGVYSWNVHRCHLGGDVEIGLSRDVVYLVGGTASRAITPESTLEEKLSEIYRIQSRKEGITIYGLFAIYTKNLYIVADSQQLIAVEAVVQPGEEYVLLRGMNYSERKLYHRLTRSNFSMARKGEFLVMEQGVKVYAQQGQRYSGITAYVQNGFEASGTEMSVFSSKILRLIRAVKHRRRCMDVREMATLLQSTPRQVLAHFSRDQGYMDHLVGETSHVGEAGSGELLFHSSKKHRVEKLLGLTLIRLGDQTFRLGDGKAVYKYRNRPGYLTTDAECGTVLGMEDMKLRVG